MPAARAGDIVAMPRRQLLLLVLCAFFTGFFVAVELIGAKLFHFTLFGLGPADFGLSGERFVATAGVLAFPLTFILTDIVNEYYGRRAVRTLTFLAIAVNVALIPVVQAAIAVDAHDFASGGVDQAMNEAYARALGQSWAIVVGSLTAFAIAQLVDVAVFGWLRRATRGRWLWLRAQGSTVISQLIDTFAVIYLAFVVIPALVPGLFAMSVGGAALVCVTNYIYKFAIAVAITPLLYAVHWGIEWWLGPEEAARAIAEAHGEPR
ncbi:MAG: queuosine precursor transporter [Planctomycetota bacterium]|nr:queuosine precursor transporter [Planctomycetota bacterium]